MAVITKFILQIDKHTPNNVHYVHNVIIVHMETVMFNKITTADARKKFSNIINRVAFGNESFVLTRRGEPLAAMISIEKLKLLQKLEDQIDLEDAWKAKNAPGDPLPWDEFKKELEL